MECRPLEASARSAKIRVAFNDAATQGRGSVAVRNERLSTAWQRDRRGRRLTLQYRWGNWLERPFSRVLQEEIDRKLGSSNDARTVEEVVQLLSQREPRSWNKAVSNRVKKKLQSTCYAHIKGRSTPKIDVLNALLARLQTQGFNVSRGDRAWEVLDIINGGGSCQYSWQPPNVSGATAAPHPEGCTRREEF